MSPRPANQPAEPSIGVDARGASAASHVPSPWPAPTSFPGAEPQSAQLNGHDLAANIPGASVRAKRDEVNAKAPLRNFLARVLNVHTDERAWRVGAKGEEKVGRELARLTDEWRVLHNIPLGDNGVDIDHLVIGPGGAFSLNTKRHPDGKVWVAERVVMVNGTKTDYLRKARFEAKQASKVLSAACQTPVAVTPVIVFVDAAAFTVRARPADVEILQRGGLVHWLRSRPPSLSGRSVEATYAAARQRSTWTR